MVAVNVSAKVTTSFHIVFGVTFEVSKFLSARTFELQRETNVSTLTFESLPKVSENCHL